MLSALSYAVPFVAAAAQYYRDNRERSGVEQIDEFLTSLLGEDEEWPPKKPKTDFRSPRGVISSRTLADKMAPVKIARAAAHANLRGSSLATAFAAG